MKWQGNAKYYFINTHGQ